MHAELTEDRTQNVIPGVLSEVETDERIDNLRSARGTTPYLRNAVKTLVETADRSLTN